MKKTTETPPSLTLDELAARWDISRRTLDHWRLQGRPMPQPCRWLGKRPVRFLLSDIEKFEADNR